MPVEWTLSCCCRVLQLQRNALYDNRKLLFVTSESNTRSKSLPWVTVALQQVSNTHTNAIFRSCVTITQLTRTTVTFVQYFLLSTSGCFINNISLKTLPMQSKRQLPLPLKSRMFLPCNELQNIPFLDGWLSASSCEVLRDACWEAGLIHLLHLYWTSISKLTYLSLINSINLILWPWRTPAICLYVYKDANRWRDGGRLRAMYGDITTRGRWGAEDGAE